MLLYTRTSTAPGIVTVKAMILPGIEIGYIVFREASERIDDFQVMNRLPGALRDRIRERLLSALEQSLEKTGKDKMQIILRISCQAVSREFIKEMELTEFCEAHGFIRTVSSYGSPWFALYVRECRHYM